MARQKPEPAQNAEATEPKKEQAAEPAGSRKGLKPGFTRVNLVVHESTDVRLYRVAKKWRMSKSEAGEKLLIASISKLAIDKKHQLADDETLSEDAEAA
jgi:hypothetical protein